MPDTTNAQLASQITALLLKWNAREAEFRAWLAGSPTGGPNGTGQYPLSDASGVTVLVDCPAKLADTLDGPSAAAAVAQQLAEAARDVTQGLRDSAGQDRALANAAKTAALDARNMAQTYRDDAAADKAAVQALLAGTISATGAPTTAHPAATHSVPVVINGVSYRLLLASP